MFGMFIRLCAIVAVGAGIVFLIQHSRAEDTPESLAADPARLREVQKLCSEDWAGTGTELCEAASQARRKRFMGSGQTRYTQQPVELFPSLGANGKPHDSDVESDDADAPTKPDPE